MSAPDILDVTLPTGLRVLVARLATVPLVQIRLGVPFGGGSAAHTSTAELLASCLTSGTGRRRRADVEDTLADAGADLRVTVGPERLTVSGQTLVNGFDAVLDVLGDCLTAPAYRPEEVELERRRLQQRVRVAEALPQYAARAAMLWHCFGDHPISRQTPTAHGVAAVSRQDLIVLHASHVVPDGAVLVLAGDLDPASALERVGARLLGWSAGFPGHRMAPPPPVTPGPLGVVARPGARQATVRLAGAALPRLAPGFPALHLANQILGGYFSARLTLHLRERLGYSYGASSSIEEHSGTAFSVVQFGCAPQQAWAAVDETFAELDRLCGDLPPADEEIAAARGYTAGLHAIALSTQAGLADALLGAAMKGLGPDWLHTYPDRLAAVPEDDVRAAAAVYLPSGAFTGVVLGPDAAVPPGQPLTIVDTTTEAGGPLIGKELT